MIHVFCWISFFSLYLWLHFTYIAEINSVVFSFYRNNCHALRMHFFLHYIVKTIAFIWLKTKINIKKYLELHMIHSCESLFLLICIHSTRCIRPQYSLYIIATIKKVKNNEKQTILVEVVLLVKFNVSFSFAITKLSLAFFMQLLFFRNLSVSHFYHTHK